jgi:hypothetical protein
MMRQIDASLFQAESELARTMALPFDRPGPSIFADFESGIPGNGRLARPA